MSTSRSGSANDCAAEQRRVDQAEDGGVGADAEAEDQDGGGGEAPVADAGAATA